MPRDPSNHDPEADPLLGPPPVGGLPSGGPAPVTAARLIRELLAPAVPGAGVMVCRVDGDPALARGDAWSGQQFLGFARPDAEKNLYCCASLIRPHDGQWGRLASRAIPRLLVIDDVGTGAGAKVDPERLGVAPTATVETSPDNYQWSYRLDPGTTVDDLKRLQSALRRAKLGDANALDPVRWFRLPGGVNNKPKVCRANGGKPFRVRCAAFDPDRVFTVEALAQGFGVSLAAPVAVLPSGPSADVPADVIEDALTWVDPACGRDPWLRVGMALHHQFGGSEVGLVLWDRWSRGDLSEGVPDNYDPEGCEQSWRSFGRPRTGPPVTIGSLWSIAEGAGWPRDPRVPRTDVLAAFGEIEAEDGGAGDVGGDDRDEVAPPRIVAAAMRQLFREETARGVEHLREGHANSAVEYPSVLSALQDPLVKLVFGATGSGKTKGLINVSLAKLTDADLAAIAATPSTVGPLIVAVSTRRELDDIATQIETLAGKDALSQCCLIRHGASVKPLRRRKDGAWNYRLILCTHGAIHHLGDDITARGRLLRLLSGAREVERKLGIAPEPLHLLIDEGDAFFGGSEMVIPLYHRVCKTVAPITEIEYEVVASRCPAAKCGAACKRHDYTFTAGVYRENVPMRIYSPGLRGKPYASEIHLPWLGEVLGTPQIQGGYRIHPINVDKLPDIPSLRHETDESGNGKWITDPVGVLVDLMRAPGATIRYTLAIDRETQQPIDTETWCGDPDSVAWPSYPCETPHLVTWDVSVFEDLEALLMSAPVYLSASWTPASLAMHEHVHGKCVRAKVRTPEDRKMRKVHLSVVPHLKIEKEQARRLVESGRVLRICRTAGTAKAVFELARQWAGKTFKPAIFIKGLMLSEESIKATFSVTYHRSALAIGANLGHYPTIILDADAFDAMMTVPCLGTDHIHQSIDAECKARVIQAFGRNLRAALLDDDETVDPDDTTIRHHIFIGGEDKVTRVLLDDAKWLIPVLEETALEVTYSVFHTHPERVIEANAELLETGTATIDDLPRTVASNKLSKRRRGLTEEARGAAKEAKKAERRVAAQARTVAKLDAFAAEGRPWSYACQQTGPTRCFAAEEVEVLRTKYAETLASN